MFFCDFVYFVFVSKFGKKTHPGPFGEKSTLGSKIMANLACAIELVIGISRHRCKGYVDMQSESKISEIRCYK